MEKPLLIVGIVTDDKLHGTTTLEEFRILLIDCLHLKHYNEAIERMIKQ